MRKKVRAWDLIYPDLKIWVKKDSFFRTFLEAGLPKKLPGFYVFHSGCNINGTLFTATGCHTSREIAERKSISEIFERYLIEVADLPSSNGCALSYSEQKAKQTAEIELWERDRIFNHYLTCAPFLNTARLKKLSSHHKTLRSLQKKLDKMGISLEAREMLPTENYFFVALAAFGDHFKGKPFGASTGFGGGTTLIEALERAIFELISLFTPVVLYPKNYNQYLSIEEFAKNGNSIIAHKHLSLSPEFGQLWRGHFFKDKTDLLCSIKIAEPKITTYSAELSFRISKLKKISLYLGVADSPLVQKPFFGSGAFYKGKPRASLINQIAQNNFINAFRKKIKNSSNFSASLPNFPHPLS